MLVMSIGRKRRNYAGRPDQAVQNMAKAIDDLAAFEDFRHEILPALQKDLKAGLSDEKIIAKYRAVVAARMVTHALDLENPSVSLAATKDLMDRTMGRAVERKQIEHRLGKLPEEELDAILLTKLQDVEDQDGGEEQ